MIRTNSQAQFCDFELWLLANKDKIKTIVDGITPVLDFIDLELLELNRTPRSDTIVEQCKSPLQNFKQYARGIACSATGHALAVVRSFYPSVKLELIDSGYAADLSDERITTLEEEVSESVI